jgi:hypothetical protein
MWGKRDCRYKTPDGTSPSIRSPSGVFSCYPLVAFSSSKDTLFGYALSYNVGYKETGQGAFSEQRKGCVRRYVIRLVGGAGFSHSRVGGIGDVRAGAALAVRRGL